MKNKNFFFIFFLEKSTKIKEKFVLRLLYYIILYLPKTSKIKKSRIFFFIFIIIIITKVK